MFRRINTGAAIAAFFYVLAIYLSSGVMRQLQQVIRELLGGYFDWVMSFGVAVFCGLGLLLLLPRMRLSLRKILALSSVLLLYGWIALFWLTIPEERLHLPQYGLLAVLLWWALMSLFKGWSLFLVVLIIGSLAGAGDELVQHFRSNRVGDWRDVWLNAISVGLAALTMRVVFTDGSDFGKNRRHEA